MGNKNQSTTKKHKNTPEEPIPEFISGPSKERKTSLKEISDIGEEEESPEYVVDDPFAKSNIEEKEVEVSPDSAADYLDVVFCIDTTGSMSTYIERSKKVIANMVKTFSENEQKPLFGIVAYRDHPPEERTYVTKIHNLGSAEKALNFLKKLDASGGGDAPEAVLQGLSDSVLKISWRNLKIPQKTYKKLLIHVGDAPPHGNDFHDPSMHDHWPEKCPSGISLDQLAKIINRNYIFYHFCRLRHETNKMALKFKAAFERFELIDLIVNKANLMEQRQEFEDFKEEFHDEEYMNRSFTKMSAGEQNEVIYEAKVSRSLAKKMKKKNKE